MAIKLCSSDNEEFVVDMKVAAQSDLVNTFLTEYDDGSDICIPLPEVSSKILKKIIEFCEHHKDDPTPNEEYDDILRRSDDIEHWDKQFIDVEQDLLFELLLASNYMIIKPLLDLGCQTVANLIRNKDAKEIREMFNIVDGFTEEERKQIRKENECAEEENEWIEEKNESIKDN
ncbi:hypothetical protein IW140_005065 [Coemansia sp. RSA 1813]|nr:hypothetical protein EV178_002203 [Coemansia sp. RSA 1646]KAJ1769258.1 hypothetical protein LPJ74_004194 [Coemansia sp. RSA 1843]KAJ2090297.1 hypothetical protein IW138_002722 [Coemansia sp. RSA 986]KAJ2215487.1 hypothetical protein EV179_002079 [Coemansia sp. RSA 487]KAJ2566083.1 hypothetical protein IW140_005065 [Coemansia sp. RSA 1813]